MKILILAGIFPPDIGGPANYLPRIATALVEKGHSVSVLCYSDTKNHNDLNYPFSIRRILRRQNIFWREILTVFWGFRMAKDCDVIYANGNDFKAMLIGFFSRKPRVHKIVGDTSWERAQNRNWTNATLDQYQEMQKGIFLRFLDWIRGFPLLSADFVITPSQYLKNIVSGWGVPSEKTILVYNSFQPLPAVRLGFENRLFQTLDSKTRWLCTICRLVPWKGVDTLIDSLDSFPDLGLMIVGDGPLEAQLKQQVKDKKMESRVIFAGRQPRSEIRHFLEKSEIFILNSSYEGLPHVVLEAMSCRRLVLASNVGGTPEVVIHQETGLLFEYNNPESIRKALALATGVEQKNLVENAIGSLEVKFSFSKMLAMTESTLLRAISQG
jgi:glycosyltransferase involved in cell wall biosynthesis